MTIPEQAVHAAAEVICAHDNAQWGDSGSPDMYHDLVGKMLTAALPFLTGVKALDDDTMQKLREALRFSASRSVMSSADEQRILSAIEFAPSPRAQALEEAAKIAFDVSENGEYMGNGDCSGNSIFQQGARYVYDEICEEIRALSSQPVADGWLPIETAPKDGTPFLVFVPDDQFSDGTGIDVIWYDEERWLFGSNTPFIPANDPTHWRLLPASPGASE